METAEFAVELCKKDNAVQTSYAMFQIREAAGRSQIFFKIGALKNLANFTGKRL